MLIVIRRDVVGPWHFVRNIRIQFDLRLFHLACRSSANRPLVCRLWLCFGTVQFEEKPISKLAHILSRIRDNLRHQLLA